MVTLADIPLREALDTVERSPEAPEPEREGWKKWVNVLWD